MILLCSRCVKVVILNVFETGINAVSFLPGFQAVFLVQQEHCSGTRKLRRDQLKEHLSVCY